MDGFATHLNQHIHVHVNHLQCMIASFTKFHLFNKARKYDYFKQYLDLGKASFKIPFDTISYTVCATARLVLSVAAFVGHQ